MTSSSPYHCRECVCNRACVCVCTRMCVCVCVCMSAVSRLGAISHSARLLKRVHMRIDVIALSSDEKFVLCPDDEWRHAVACQRQLYLRVAVPSSDQGTEILTD